MKDKIAILKQFLALARIKRQKGEPAEAQAALELEIELTARIKEMERSEQPELLGSIAQPA